MKVVKFNLKIFLIFLMLLIIAGCSNEVNNIESFNETIEENTQEELTFEEEIIQIIKANKDGKEYYKAYSNANIVSIEKKSYQELLNESKKTNYPGLYRNLTSSDSLYEVRVNGGKNLELLAIVNYQEKEVVNIIGLYLVSMG